MKRIFRMTIIGVLSVLMFFAGGRFCLADDPALKQLKAENSDLKNKNIELSQAFDDIYNDRQAILNKFKFTLNENADLKDRAPLRDEKRTTGYGIIVQRPNEAVLRKKLVEAMLELTATKNKDEGLKRDVGNMHYNLGALFQGQNRYDEAIREFRMDLIVNPNDADAYYNLALIYDKAKNNRKQAINHYSTYLKINPDAADALKVKERLTDLATEQKIWGDPDATGIGEKGTLGRL